MPAGEDIAWEVASVAREVVLSAKTWMNAEFGKQVLPFGPRENMYRRDWVQELRPDGSVLLEDGSLVEDVDVVMFCTGASVFLLLQRITLVAMNCWYTKCDA